MEGGKGGKRVSGELGVEGKGEKKRRSGRGMGNGAGFVQPVQSVSDTAGAAVSSIVLFTEERSFHMAERQLNLACSSCQNAIIKRKINLIVFTGGELSPGRVP